MQNIALSLPEIPQWSFWLGGIVLLFCLPRLLGIVYIPHTQVGIIEKIWSSKGSLREGQIIARNGEAGYQARFLRGGIHEHEPCGSGVCVRGHRALGRSRCRSAMPLRPLG